MANKKYLMLAGGLTSLGLAGTIGLHTVSAQSSQSGGQTLADKLASTFHLNKNDVQKVIDQDRQDHQAERKQKLEDRLMQAVKDGKITEAQKTLILNKLDELQKQRAANKGQNRTPQQRHQAMQKEMSDLKAWAKANNLPTNLVMPPMHGPGHGGQHQNDTNNN